MTNRRDVMSDMSGSRELIEEHTANLLYKIEQLLDQVLDLEEQVEDLMAENASLSENLEAAITDYNDVLQELKDRDGI